MSRLTSLTIGMPSMGSIKTFSVASMLDIIFQTGVPITFSYPVHTYTHEARRICVEEALKDKSSHLFFMDSDMMMPGDIVKKLAAHNKPVVGANYNERRLPLTYTVKMGKDRPENFSAEQVPDRLFKCYAVATGAILIDLKVFEKMERPWFFYSSFPDGKMDFGEDVWFCKKVREAGFDVWCDPTIPVRHIGEFAY